MLCTHQRSGNLCLTYFDKIQSIGFLLLNNIDQNIKISTIVETLVTLDACAHFGKAISRLNNSVVIKIAAPSFG